MVMQVMQPLLGQLDPRPDSSPVGTDISRNLKLELHHGRAVAALSGINPDERTGHRPVVLVRAERPHSLLPDARFQLEVIVISLRGYTTSTSESTTLMIGQSRPTEPSLNIFKTPNDITHNNKQIMKPPWNCLRSSITTLKHSTSATGITLHPVSKLAWGGESPKVTCILPLHVSLFHHLALHALKKRVESVTSISLLVSFILLSHEW